MKNLRKFLNSKKGKIIISAICTLIVIVVIIALSSRFIKKDERIDNVASNNHENKVNIKHSNDEEYLSYMKLSEDSYKIDKENNKVILNNNLKAVSVCVSKSSEGPLDTDKWLTITGDKTYEIPYDDEVSKVYVYYLAKVVSTMDEFNEDATLYVMRSTEDFKSFGEMVNSGNDFEGKSFYLMNDITLTEEHTPIGTETTPFSGTFNGNGYTISNLNINSTVSSTTQTNVGLFGYCTNAVIKNLTVEGTLIFGESIVGGICGYGVGGTIKNCINKVNIKANKNVAGIAGSFTDGDIINCQNFGVITGGANGGAGIVSGFSGGRLYNCVNNGEITKTGNGHVSGGIVNGASGKAGTYTTVKNCINNAKVTGGQYTSGIAAIGHGAGSLYSDAAALYIINCKNTGYINNTYQQSGGIIGNTSKTSIIGCINEGTVKSSGRMVGGMIGDTSHTVLVEGCRNEGTISTGGNHVGGIVGYANYDTKSLAAATVIRYCSNIGKVSATGGNSAGICGYNDATNISNVYNIGSITGSENVGHIRGYATGNYNSVSNYYRNTSLSITDKTVFFTDDWGLNSTTGETSSNYMVLECEIEPKIMLNPFSYINPTEETVKLTTIAEGANLSYQWYRIDEANVAGVVKGVEPTQEMLREYEGTLIEGATSSEYDAPVTTDRIWYYCVVTGLEVTGQEEGTYNAITKSTTLRTDAGYVGPGEIFSNTSVLMERDDTRYLIGNELRAGWSNEYLADSIVTINIIDSEEDILPENYIATWDVSSKRNGSVNAYLFETATNGKYDLYIEGQGGILLSEDCNNLFAGYTNCTAINGMDNIITNETVQMQNMFENCTSLKILDLSGFNTDKVTDMSKMFNNCSSMTSLNIDNFRTSNVKAMNAMFANCNLLSKLNVTSFDTHNVTNMNSIFNSCRNLTQIDLNSFETYNVTDMGYMFKGCESLNSLDLNSFNTLQVTNMLEIFNGCKSLESINMKKFNTFKIEDMSNIFKDCESLKSLDLSDWNTFNVTNMSGMFWNCKELTTIDLSNFITNKVEDMSNMFNGCLKLTSLDLYDFNTIKVTNMEGMFKDNKALKNINISKFNTSNVTTMKNMFLNCAGLQKINLNNIKVDKVTDMSNMFAGCSSLTSLNLKNFNNTAIRTEMFKDMTGLKNIFIGSNFGSLDGDSMFENCTSLEAIIMQKAITSASEAQTLGTQTGLNSNAILYVPNLKSVEEYNLATNYASVFTNGRIKEMTEIIGDNPVIVKGNDEYIDSGEKVAGYDKDSAVEYTQYGYFVDTTGLPIDKEKEGIQEVIYTLKFGDL